MTDRDFCLGKIAGWLVGANAPDEIKEAVEKLRADPEPEGGG
jgi:hypothetical protein